jgi:hypothetical protein
MPTQCSADLFKFGTVEGRALVGSFSGETITSDVGALLLGATDQAGEWWAVARSRSFLGQGDVVALT